VGRSCGGFGRGRAGWGGRRLEEGRRGAQGRAMGVCWSRACGRMAAGWLLGPVFGRVGVGGVVESGVRGRVAVAVDVVWGRVGLGRSVRVREGELVQPGWGARSCPVLGFLCPPLLLVDGGIAGRGWRWWV